jgi:hypothetical protein
MSDSDHDDTTTAAAPVPAKKAVKKVVTSLKKIEEYREEAYKQFGPLARSVFDFMCMKPSVQASYISLDDVVIGDRDDIQTFGKENWTRPEEVPEDKKWTQTSALEDTIKSLSKLAPKTGNDEDRAIYMKRHIAVYATVKMPDGAPEFKIMGYLMSAVDEEPRQFHPFASKQWPVFHSKSFDGLAHLKDETQELETLEIDDVTFDFIEFDFRYYIDKWVKKQRDLEKSAATQKGSDDEEEEEEEEKVEKKEEQEPPKKPQPKKKAATTTTTSSNTNAKKLTPSLQDPRQDEFERRNIKAGLELAKILNNPDASTRAAILGPVTDPPLAMVDMKRISFFPESFHVDRKFLADAEKLNADHWETRPICMATMASCMDTRYNTQGPLVYSIETEIPPRSDTIPQWLSSWENHALGETWDSATTYAELAVAGEFMKQLARSNSAILKRGMAFRMAAQLTQRVLRIREVTSCKGFPGIYCCITNEPIAEGTRCDAWDLELNPAYLPAGMPSTMTLLVKQKASKACPLFPRKKVVGDGGKSPARPKSPAKKQAVEEKKTKTPAATASDPFEAAAKAAEVSKKRKAPEPVVAHSNGKGQEEEAEEPKTKKAKVDKDPVPAPAPMKKTAVSKKFFPQPEFINIWPRDMVVHGTALWHAFKQSWMKKDLEENKDFLSMISLVMSQSDLEIKKNMVAPTTKESMWALFDVILAFVKPREAVADIEAGMLAETKEPDVDAMDFMDVLDMVDEKGGADGKKDDALKVEYRTDLPEPGPAIFTLYKIAAQAIKGGKRPMDLPLLDELYPTPESVLKTPNAIHHMAFVALFSE